MAETAHPRRGQIRISCDTMCTNGTVVQVADGEGGWVKVAGITAVHWSAPGKDQLTRASLAIEGALLEVHVAPEQVTQMVASAEKPDPVAAGASAGDTWADLNTFRVPRSPPSSRPTPILHLPLANAGPPPAHIWFSVEFRRGEDTRRVEIQVPDRHLHDRLCAVFNASPFPPPPPPCGLQMHAGQIRYPFPSDWKASDADAVFMSLPKLHPGDSPVVYLRLVRPDGRICPTVSFSHRTIEEGARQLDRAIEDGARQLDRETAESAYVSEPPSALSLERYRRWWNAQPCGSAARRLSVEAISAPPTDAAEIGFGPLDPPPAPEPEPPSAPRPFDEALSRALRAHRSL